MAAMWRLMRFDGVADQGHVVDEDLRLAVGDGEIELLARPPGVEPDRDGSDRHGRPERHHPLDRVATEDRDPVPLADAPLRQPLRDLPDVCMVVGIGDAAVTVDEVVTVAECERGIQQRAQRAVPVTEHRHPMTEDVLLGEVERQPCCHRVPPCSTWPTRMNRSATCSAPTATAWMPATSPGWPSSSPKPGSPTITAPSSPPVLTRCWRCGPRRRRCTPSLGARSTAAARGRVTSRPTR